MKFHPALFVLLLTTLLARSEMLAPVPLWPDGAPGARGTSTNDIPTITPYLADSNQVTGAAMVICPGGAYVHLAPHEGNDYALYLNQHGIAAFVLKYRLGKNGYRHPVMLNDMQRAMRLVRAKAAEWNIDPKRVGVMGSSAGGHMAAMAVTHFDAGSTNAADLVERESCRPDLGVLCYPVISMGAITHAGSKKALLGDDPSPELVQFTSTELNVTSNTPPCFIWQGWDDKTVKVENSLVFAQALRSNGVRFDLHIYQHANDGVGMFGKPPSPEPLPWVGELVRWLKEQGFTKWKS